MEIVRNELHIPITVEVGNAAHVEMALKHQIDILWIGARTTVNPFAVQEIADALRGVDIPVMIKNPMNPDLELWMGALERMYAVGITKLAAIHRGFSDAYDKRMPHLVAEHAYRVAQSFSKFYAACPVLAAPVEAARGSRLALSATALRQLETALDLLGIDTPERM